MSKDNEVKLALSEAMSKLADRLEKFQDPILWQKLIQYAMRVGALPPLPQPITATGPSPVRIEAVTISLSDEEREKLAGQVYEAVNLIFPNLVTL